MTGYSLGVDLGTTYSAAATVDGTGIPAMVGLGNRSMQIPSVLFIGADGELLVGEPAERRARDDPTRIVREFKRRMGDSVAIYLGGKPFPIEQLTARLLRWVIDQTAERMGGEPAQLTLTHPAAWTEFNVGRLRRAAEIAGFPDVTMCPEPVAAAFQYARNNLVSAGDRICIYDLGGGTFDVCVVGKTVDGFEILGSPSGLDPLGGIDFDKLVINRVQDELSLLNLDADPEDAGFWRLGRDCVDAKEALSTDVDVTIPVAVGGLTASLRLTRSEFESMIEEKLDETIRTTQRVLRSAGLTSADLTAFVLVGGSSRIPAVSEKLATTFHCPLALNTHPKHEVALGAALAGHPVVAAPAPDNSPPVAIETTNRQAHRTGRVRPARSARRWRRPMLISAGITAIVATVLFGGGWLAAPGSMDSARADGSLQRTDASPAAATDIAASTTPASTTAAPTTPPALPDPSAAASTTQSALVPDDPATGAQTPLTVPPTTPTAAPPDTFDAGTVTWLQVLCNGGYQLQQAEVTATRFRNLTAAQQSFKMSYTRQATIAAQTADTLDAMEPALVANGRIDTRAAVAGLRLLSDLFTAGAQTIAGLTPTVAADIEAAVAGIKDDRARKYSAADMGQLTPEETAFVGGLPGCQVLVAPR